MGSAEGLQTHLSLCEHCKSVSLGEKPAVRQAKAAKQEPWEDQPPLFSL